MPTKQQLIPQIHMMEAQGVHPQQIQSHLDSFKTAQSTPQIAPQGTQGGLAQIPKDIGNAVDVGAGLVPYALSGGHVPLRASEQGPQLWKETGLPYAKETAPLMGGLIGALSGPPVAAGAKAAASIPRMAANIAGKIPLASDFASGAARMAEREMMIGGKTPYGAEAANKYSPQSIEGLLDTHSGWKPGARAKFDKAILDKDANTINQMIPEIPQDYKQRFAQDIESITGNKQPVVIYRGENPANRGGFHFAFNAEDAKTFAGPRGSIKTMELPATGVLDATKNPEQMAPIMQDAASRGLDYKEMLNEFWKKGYNALITKDHMTGKNIVVMNPALIKSKGNAATDFVVKAGIGTAGVTYGLHELLKRYGPNKEGEFSPKLGGKKIYEQ